jgi:hypothetical protein
LTLFNEIGILDPIVWTYRTLGCALVRQGAIARARQILLKSQSMGRKISNGDQFGDPSGDQAFILWMGITAESQEQPALAARLLGAVEAVQETFFKPLDTIDRNEFERLRDRLRTGPDKAVHSAAWAEGRQLSFEQALEEALVYCREPGE